MFVDFVGMTVMFLMRQLALILYQHGDDYDVGGDDDLLRTLLVDVVVALFQPPLAMDGGDDVASSFEKEIKNEIFAQIGS